MELAPDLQLPSLPEVLLRALEACHQNASSQAISDIISSDTALVARTLALANSPVYGSGGQIHSVEQALLALGVRRFESLILTAATRQLLFDLDNGDWQQIRDFWRHSLTTALTARALATLTGYPHPEEAFMLGAVHNISELVALKTPATDARQHYLDHQCDIAADLVTAWGLGPMAADAMRYQQALPDELRDASHLVKLISLATRLALSDATGIAAANTVFGLNEDLTREINRRIGHEVTAMAVTMGITLDKEYDGHAAIRELKEVILQQALVNQALALADLSASTEDTLSETVNSLALLTGYPALCFLHKGDTLALTSGSQGDTPEMIVSAKPGGSALTEAFTTRTPVSLADRKRTVMDRQLLSLTGTPLLLAVPVMIADDCIAVFALGTDQSSHDTVRELATRLSHQLGQTLANRQPASDTPAVDEEIEQELSRQQLRKQIHEVSNPLTIIRQYIYQLRNRLEDPEVHEELDVIQEELDRAGNLLMRMNHTEERTNEAEGIPLNDALESLIRILEDTLLDDRNCKLRLELTDSPTLVTGPASAVRQVIINLLRNAAEALPEEGGSVTLRTSAPVWQNQRTWVELEISDTGPGIPEDVRERLFAPVKTTKGEGHSGLGLSIVKQLVDDMEGIIACRTGPKGTTFRILFPAASPKRTKKTDDETTGTDQ